MTVVRTCVRVTPQGGPYARFKRALAQGDLFMVRAAAAELPHLPPLDDALQICLLLRAGEPGSYDRAVVRWLGRFCLERPYTTFEDLRRAADAFDRLPANPDLSVRVLHRLVDRSA